LIPCGVRAVFVNVGHFSPSLIFTGKSRDLLLVCSM
jgi:hypothetical protein